MGGIRNMARFKSLADQADSQEAICDYMYYYSGSVVKTKK